MKEKDGTLKAWVYHTEWWGLMATILACFLFVHHENSSLTKRLDDHIAQNQVEFNEIHKRSDEINRRIDESNQQLNKRCDDLHKRDDDLHNEFYELLKEIRNK